MQTYQQRIMQATMCNSVEAVGVEAYMRLEHGTLDGLSAAKFSATAKEILPDVRVYPNTARDLARSFGLVSP